MAGKPMPDEWISVSLLDQTAGTALETKVHWLLRVALFCEFLGHGAFGLLTKSAWVPYFAVFGIPEVWAYRLMPLVGTMDIFLAVSTLAAPTRAALLYMTAWGVFTSLLRPLAGEGWWEFFERAYNFGLPGLMLWVHGPACSPRSWFAVISKMPRISPAASRRTMLFLRVIMACMLIGHGGYGLVMHKPILVQHYAAAGLGAIGTPLPALSAAIGGFEMCLGVLCLAVDWTPFFIFVFAWKITTEFLHVPAHAVGAGWEWIERAGSYASPLLWIALNAFKRKCTK